MVLRKQLAVVIFIVIVLLGIYLFFIASEGPEDGEELTPEQQSVFDSLEEIDSDLMIFAKNETPEIFDETYDFANYGDFLVWTSDLSDEQLALLKTRLLELNGKLASSGKPNGCIRVYLKTVKLTQSFAETENFIAENEIGPEILNETLCEYLGLISRNNELEEKTLQKLKELYETVDQEYEKDALALTACKIKPTATDLTEIERDLAQKRANFSTAKQQCQNSGEINLYSVPAVDSSRKHDGELYLQEPSPNILPEDVLDNISYLEQEGLHEFYNKFIGDTGDMLSPESLVGHLSIDFGAYGIYRVGRYYMGEKVMNLGGKIAQATRLKWVGGKAAQGVTNLWDDIIRFKRTQTAASAFTIPQTTSLNNQIGAALQSATAELTEAKSAFADLPEKPSRLQRLQALKNYRTAKNSLQVATRMEKIAQAAATANRGGEIATLTADAAGYQRLLEAAKTARSADRATKALSAGKNVETALKAARAVSLGSKFLRATLVLVAIDIGLNIVAEEIENSTLNYQPKIDITEILDKSEGLGGRLTGLNALLYCTEREGIDPEGIFRSKYNFTNLSRIHFVEKVLGQEIYLFSIKCTFAEDTAMAPPTEAKVKLNEVEEGLSEICETEKNFSKVTLKFNPAKGFGDGPLTYDRYYPLRAPVELRAGGADFCYKVTINEARSISPLMVDVPLDFSFPTTAIILSDLLIEINPQVFGNIENLEKVLADVSTMENLEQEVAITTITISKNDLQKIYPDWDTKKWRQELANPDKEKNIFPTLVIKKPLGPSNVSGKDVLLLLPASIRAHPKATESIDITFIVPQMDKYYALAFFKDGEIVRENILVLNIDRDAINIIDLAQLLRLES